MQSSTKADYITLSEAAREQKFTQISLQDVAYIDTPGYIYGDNEAQIFFSRNKKVSNITNHVDIREHSIRSCVYKGRSELKKVISKNNSLDIMTKMYQWIFLN